MRTIIGTDEAGYGPNLGPLLIATTKWKIAGDDVNLRRLLEDVVCQHAEESDERIEVADSKQLYSSGQGLERLERGVMAFATTLGFSTNSFLEFLSNCCNLELPTNQLEAIYCSAGEFECPVEVANEQVKQDADRLAAALKKQGVEFCGFYVRCIFPDSFNNLLDHRENKATLLSHETLEMVHELMEPDTPHHIFCDKHGGRSKYAGLIQHCLTDSLVSIREESLERSHYNWSDNSIEFIARGESYLPIALASMAAKYVREQLMSAWNRFWQTEIPGIRPTAGYPVDARRFKAEISQRQDELGITDRAIWRLR